MIRLFILAFFVLILSNPWQYAEFDANDVASDDMPDFLPPIREAEAAKAYLITDLGNTFLINNQTVTDGPVNSIVYDIILRSSRMVNHTFNGFVLSGVDLDAERSNIAPVVNVNGSATHAGVIQNGTTTSIAVPRFYSTYVHGLNGTLIELNHNPPAALLNVEGYATLRGSANAALTTSGIEFTGDGMAVAKLGPVSGGRYIMNGEVPAGSSVLFVTSPNNLLDVTHDGRYFVLLEGKSIYGDRARNITLGWNQADTLSRVFDANFLNVTDISEANCKPKRGTYWSQICTGNDPYPDDLVVPIIMQKSGYGGYYINHYHVKAYEYDVSHSRDLPVYMKSNGAPSFTWTHIDTPHGGEGIHLYNSKLKFEMGNGYNFPDAWSGFGVCGNCLTNVENNKPATSGEPITRYNSWSCSQPCYFRPSSTIQDVTVKFESYETGGYHKIHEVSAEAFYKKSTASPNRNCYHHSLSDIGRERCLWGLNVVADLIIRDDAPYDLRNRYTYDFLSTYQNPANAYVIVEPAGNTVKIEGVSTVQHVAPFFEMRNVPRDTYYSISAGNDTTYGKTSHTGRIVVMPDEFSVDSYQDGGTITFYHDALKYANYNFGTAMFDLANNATLRIGNDVEINIPHDFVNIDIPMDVHASDITLINQNGTLALPYLTRSYTENDRMAIPYIPGYDSFRITFDGHITHPMNFTDVRRQ